MLNKDDIIKKVKELNFSSDQYLVFSGGSLAAHGIRQTSDVDLVVKSELFDKLVQTGKWQLTTGKDNTKFLVNDNIEITSQLAWSDYPTTLEEAKSREILIDGVPFMSLADLIEFKQALGRNKDDKDIELINNYLEAYS